MGEYLRDRHGLEVLVPDAASRQRVHDVIYDELCLGTITEASRAAYQGVIEDLRRAGAQAIILGCTEITLLIRREQPRVSATERWPRPLAARRASSVHP